MRSVSRILATYGEPEDYVHRTRPTRLVLTPEERIQVSRMTSEEIEAAREALPYFLAAEGTPLTDSPGGADPRRYKGRTADEVVAELVPDEKRQLAVLNLVVALAKEGGE
jgi:uncharacterized protein (UPF0261 family)